MTPKQKLRVVIAGGGVAGVETMLALRAFAEERVDATLVTPDSTFVYQPLAVVEPFGLGSPLRVPLGEITADCGAAYEQAAALLVDGGENELHTSRGTALPYDALVLALGARTGASIPGAIAFGGQKDARAIEMLLEDLENGLVKRVVFAVPTGVGWTLPLYELALLTAEHILDAHLDAAVCLVTPEEHPLAAFGAEATKAVTGIFRERGIDLRAGLSPQSFADGRLNVVAGEPLAADRVLTLPRLLGRRVDGVPQDADGFIPTDDLGHVDGMANVYAVGDIARFPIKQGGLAAQQADAVAKTIAARAGADVAPEPFRPVLRGLLLTGRRPTFMRAEISGGRGETSVTDSEPLWWPGGKIAARFLGPYLALHARSPSGARYEPSGLVL